MLRIKCIKKISKNKLVIGHVYECKSCTSAMLTIPGLGNYAKCQWNDVGAGWKKRGDAVMWHGNQGDSVHIRRNKARFRDEEADWTLNTHRNERLLERNKAAIWQIADYSPSVRGEASRLQLQAEVLENVIHIEVV